MKKLFSLAIALMLVIGLFGGTVAAGGEGSEGVISEETSEAGLLPDSPFYFLKTIIEKIRVVLTFNDDNKTDLLAELVDRRTLELEALEEKYADSELTTKQEKRLDKAAASLEKSAERLFDRVLGNDGDFEGENLDEKQILHLEKALDRIGMIIDRVVKAEDQCDGEECQQLQERYRERITKLEQIRDRNPDAQGLNKAIENAHRQQVRWEERLNADPGNPEKDKDRENDNNSENPNNEGKTKGKSSK